MSLRLFKTAHQKVDTFCNGRTRQPDELFIQDCDLPEDEDAERVALAVRRAVARVGLVDPLYIRADDREMVELSALPLWDSMDWISLLLYLQDELGITIPDREAECIRVSKFSVRGCVHDTLAVVQRLRSLNQE